MTLYIIGSVDGTGDGERTDGEPGSGETIYRRHSTGFESFR